MLPTVKMETFVKAAFLLHSAVKISRVSSNICACGLKGEQADLKQNKRTAAVLLL